MAEKKHWYENKTLVKLLLIFFYPIGLFGYIKCPNKPKITMVIMSIVMGFCILTVILSSNTTANSNVVSDNNTETPRLNDSLKNENVADNHEPILGRNDIPEVDVGLVEVEELVPIQESETTVPHQSELLAYIEKEMYILDGNGYFNTIAIRPFEFEITEYKINNKNRISSIAVRVYYTDMSDGQNSQLITYTAVQIVINWLAEYGFDPFEEWIGITCRGYFRETGATGQSQLRTWGYSEYDWNNDFIIWKPATN
jgi:hypothetical protein